MRVAHVFVLVLVLPHIGTKRMGGKNNTVGGNFHFPCSLDITLYYPYKTIMVVSIFFSIIPITIDT